MNASYNPDKETDYTSTPLKKLQIQTQHEQTQLQEKNAHEKEMAKTAFDNQKELKKQEYEHEEKMQDKSLGFLGRLFGNKESASKNITATICILLAMGVSVISCIVYFCTQDLTFIGKMWEGLFPLITLSLGYLFGKNN